MRKVIFLIHLSLDGFTSGPNDELDWIAYDQELEQDAHALHDRTDAVIWGRRTDRSSSILPKSAPTVRRTRSSSL